MKIGTVANPSVVTIGPDDSIAQAARLMREYHVGDLVVVKPGERVPLGVLTDRDLVVGVLAQDVDHIKLVRVSDVMTQKPVIAKDTEDMSEVLDRMRRNVIRRVPVVDAKGHLVGIFTLDDLLGVFADDFASIGALVSRQRTFEAEKRPL